MIGSTIVRIILSSYSYLVFDHDNLNCNSEPWECIFSLNGGILAMLGPQMHLQQKKDEITITRRL